MRKLLGYPKMLEEAKMSKPGHSWIVELLIFLVVLLIGQRAESIPVSIATTFWCLTDSSVSGASGFGSVLDNVMDILSSMPEWLMILSLFATGLLTWVVFVYCRKIERRSAASMGFRKNGSAREYLIGAIIGLLMITASLVIAMLTGSVTVTPKNLAAPSISVLLFWLAGYVIQGMSEETLVRGYLMISMSRKTPIWICIILSSAVFALLHLGNPGIGALPLLNLFLSGLVFAVYVLKRGNLWGACAMHTFWNFYQGCIYGVSVSGTGSVDSALFECVSIENMELWNGGAFGLEGGIAVTIVEAVTLLIILFLVPKSKTEQAVLTGPVDGTFREVRDETGEKPSAENVATENVSAENPSAENVSAENLSADSPEMSEGTVKEADAAASKEPAGINHASPAQDVSDEEPKKEPSVFADSSGSEW